MFAFIIFDGDFDLPQYLLIDLADRRTEGRDGGRRVEIENVQEILMLKVFVRVEAAAGHEGVGDADGSGISELHSDVKIIIFL